jgi:type II restriction enzyme
VTWDDELERVVADTWKVGESFTLDDVYSFEPHFAGLYPRNDHVKDKLRQTLQHLRDHHLVEFVDDRGTYRRLR